MIKTENFNKVQITSQQELRDWLLLNHDQNESVWLVTFKKTVTAKYVSNGEVLDELIAYGWIDGIHRKLDEQRTMQLISKRKTQHWSKTYKDRAQRLIEEDKMMPSGLQSISSSKENGLWHFMDDVDALIKPQDFQEALNKYPKAQANFDAFGASIQGFTLRWIKLAKTEATRKRRIHQAAALAADGKKIPGV